MKLRLCELCNANAALFCPSDAAFLCRNCDTKVHEANFLVARHVRRAVCSNCRSFTGDFITGVDSLLSALCPSCEEDDLGSLSSSSTTSPANKVYSCDSSSTVTVRRTLKARVTVSHVKAESVFNNWCGKLGIEDRSATLAACRALKACNDRWTGLPFRVCLAASMWIGLRLSLEKTAVTGRILKRLEEISGVPAKIILAAVSKLDRVDKLELEEGWAES
ncbi:B-box zinc finger protein 32-like [Salvia divinorum]|uniref:B-box zinc finger protein 32-like n=1 Tax=Salvia divinorum TaxID=28513 RepID=A0ABD1H620_SALDI